MNTLTATLSRNTIALHASDDYHGTFGDIRAYSPSSRPIAPSRALELASEAGHEIGNIQYGLALERDAGGVQ